LPGHIKFHTSPPSIDRPRHRNRNVPSSVVIDNRGREHLYLNFWIEALPAGDPFSASNWNLDIREWDWSLDGLRAWVSLERQKISVQVRRAFTVLTGEPVSKASKAETPIDTHSSVSSPPPATSGSSSGDSRSPLSRSVWSTFVGMFSAIRPGTSLHQSTKTERLVYTSGEVHVDLIRVRRHNTLAHPINHVPSSSLALIQIL
jgi:import inner membrane translocase subunit TIM21